ncbi:FUN14 domain-containing protein 2 isoform X1 [Accipiter gentilis]|uniref:FUN14 domain-containing protein 2 isoform X1 n=1 Tax=Astur gentilis TaxID=8957 RepID=UPI002110599A|nr:FUN14 domain-containing protein 2 isoform X1 [Accipiter gentilis]
MGWDGGIVPGSPSAAPPAESRTRALRGTVSIGNARRPVPGPGTACGPEPPQDALEAAPGTGLLSPRPGIRGMTCRSTEGCGESRGQSPSVKEDSFNVLDLAEYTKNRPWWRKVFAPSSGSSAEKYNVATQLVIGGVTGWCTGFIFQKVGKLAATAVGGGFFLLQIANHTGYIKVDWKLVERDVNKAKQQLKFHSSGNKMSPEVKSRVDEVIIFLKKNIILTGGFAGGFLLGMAS